MKRIAIWGHSGGYGGVERMIYNFYKYMDKSNIQYDFLVPHNYGKIAFEDEILAMGGRVFRILYSEGESLIKSRKCWKQYFKENPEVIGIHLHTYFPYAFPLKMAKKAGINIRIFHAHGSGEKNENQSFISKIKTKRVKKDIDKYPSKYAACGELAAKSLFGEKDYTWIKNGIEVSKFAFDEGKRAAIRSKYNIKDDDILVGQIGHLSNLKQPLFTIEVVEEALKKNNSIKLFFIGDGPLYKEVEKTIEEKGLNNNIFLLGSMTDVSDYYQAIDCLVLPSLHEGFPVVLVEAQTAGVRCLISDNVTNQAIQTDLCKMLDINDKDKWVDSIIDLQPVSNREKYKDNILSKGFDISDVVKEIEKLYK